MTEHYVNLMFAFARNRLGDKTPQIDIPTEPLHKHLTQLFLNRIANDSSKPFRGTTNVFAKLPNPQDDYMARRFLRACRILAPDQIASPYAHYSKGSPTPATLIALEPVKMVDAILCGTLPERSLHALAACRMFGLRMDNVAFNAINYLKSHPTNDEAALAAFSQLGYLAEAAWVANQPAPDFPDANPVLHGHVMAAVAHIAAQARRSLDRLEQVAQKSWDLYKRTDSKFTTRKVFDEDKIRIADALLRGLAVNERLPDNSIPDQIERRQDIAKAWQAAL